MRITLRGIAPAGFRGEAIEAAVEAAVPSVPSLRAVSATVLSVNETITLRIGAQAAKSAGAPLGPAASAALASSVAGLLGLPRTGRVFVEAAASADQPAASATAGPTVFLTATIVVTGVEQDAGLALRASSALASLDSTGAAASPALPALASAGLQATRVEAASAPTLTAAVAVTAAHSDPAEAAREVLIFRALAASPGGRIENLLMELGIPAAVEIAEAPALLPAWPSPPPLAPVESPRPPPPGAPPALPPPPPRPPLPPAPSSACDPNPCDAGDVCAAPTVADAARGAGYSCRRASSLLAPPCPVGFARVNASCVPCALSVALTPPGGAAAVASAPLLLFAAVSPGLPAWSLCNAAGGLSYSWTVRTSGGGGWWEGPAVRSFAGGPTLLLPARSVVPGGRADVALRVCFAAAAGGALCGAASAAVDFAHPPLSAVLSGGNSTAGGGGPPLLFDCGRSSDPLTGSAEGLSFSWDCEGPTPRGCLTSTLEPVAWAPNSPTQLVSLLGPSHPDEPAAAYTVTCTVRKGGRRAAAASVVRVGAGYAPRVHAWVEEEPGANCSSALARPFLPTPPVAAAPRSGLTACPPLASAQAATCAGVTLVGMASSLFPASLTASWEVASGGPLDANISLTDSSVLSVEPAAADGSAPLRATLSLPAGALRAGRSYSFRIAAADALGAARAEVAVASPAAPRGALPKQAVGEAAAAPGAGLALRTAFSLSATSWQAPTGAAAPLLFQWQYFAAPPNSTAWDSGGGRLLVPFRPAQAATAILPPGDWWLQLTARNAAGGSAAAAAEVAVSVAQPAGGAAERLAAVADALAAAQQVCPSASLRFSARPRQGVRVCSAI